MSVYLILKFLHVLLAIVAIGFNVSYPIWLARAAAVCGEATVGAAAAGLEPSVPESGRLLRLPAGVTWKTVPLLPAPPCWVVP